MTMYYLHVDSFYLDLDLFVNAGSAKEALKLWQDYYREGLEGCVEVIIYTLDSTKKGALAWPDIPSTVYTREKGKARWVQS